MRHKIQIVIESIATIALIAGGGWYWYTHTKTAPPEKVPTSDFSYTKTQDGSRSHIEDTPAYHIDVTYPDNAGIEATAGKKNDGIATQTMELFVRQEIADFLEQQKAWEVTPEQAAQGRPIYQRSFSIGYTHHSSPQASSFVFTLFSDTGGAHPITYSKTFVWSTMGGQILLGDLLEGAYLERLSTLSSAEVRAHLEAQSEGAGDTIFEEGFAPEEKNFENFYLEGGDLVILFDPYQVAAYAAGPQEARIPLSTIQDILRPEFK